LVISVRHTATPTLTFLHNVYYIRIVGRLAVLDGIAVGRFHAYTRESVRRLEQARVHVHVHLLLSSLIGFDIAALPLLYLISYELDRIQDEHTCARVEHSYATAYL
jgi:hypothetical protein